MALRIDRFGSIRPLSDPRNLSGEEAQKAHNCRLDSGTIVPLHEPAVIQWVPVGSRTVYRHDEDWLTWLNDVNVTKGFLHDDQYGRIYYTGDGAPKVRGIVASVERVYDLGVPRPTGTPAVQTIAKTESSWYREWSYFYEEPDGTRKDEGTLQEGTQIQVVLHDKEFSMSIPSRVTASADAKFVAFFEGRRSKSGAVVGRVYPAMSAYSGNTDLYIDGAAVTANQVNTGSTAKYTLVYDTSEAGRYTMDRSYTYTLVNVYGEEGPPSDPSEVVTVEPTDVAVITGLTASEFMDGYAPIVAIRIYRTVTGIASTEFQFVTELDIAEYLSFTDQVDEADTGEVLPSTYWTAPPAGLTGIIPLPGGFYAAFEGNKVWFSEPGYAHAWPERYQVSVKGSIVGISVTDNTLVVVTNAEPYLITVNDPASVTVTEVPDPQPCISKRSVVTWGGSVFYASADGIVAISGMSTRVITKDYISKKQWRDLSPETMTIVVYDDELYLFSDSSSYIVSAKADGIQITTHDVSATAAWVDVENDALMLADINGRLLSWEAEGDTLQSIWRSKEFVLSRPAEFSVIRVVADGYPVRVNYYAENEEVLTLDLSNDVARRIPSLRHEKVWSFEVSGKSRIRELLISSSMGDLSS